MPLAGWDTMLMKIDTTSTPSPAPHKFLTNGDSDARSFVLRARSAAYGEDVCLSGSTGLFPWVTQCEFGLKGQLPVRVLKGGVGSELVMRVKARGSDGVTFWFRALVGTGSQANLVRGDITGKLLVPSRCPVRIVQANGDPVKGVPGRRNYGLLFGKGCSQKMVRSWFGGPLGCFMRQRWRMK